MKRNDEVGSVNAELKDECLTAFHSAFIVRRSSLLFASLLLASLSVLAVRAQSDSFDTEPTRGGLNSIQGNVYLPSGRRLERRVRVRLTSVRTGDMSTMTDANGSFYFRRLAAGTYRISIDAGREFEAAGETVDILEGGDPRSGQNVTVQIQLQLKSEGGKTSAAAVVDAALAAIPKQARDLYERALKSANSGEHKKAVEHLKAALEIHPQFALALNELGVQHLKLNQAEDAARAFRSALELAPNAPVFHLNLGILFIQQKNFAEAEKALRRAAELDDALVGAHLYLGRALIGLARYDEAERELRRAVALGGDSARMAHRYLGVVYIERGEPARAVDALETYLRLEPKAKEAAQIREIIKDLRTQSAPPRK